MARAELETARAWGVPRSIFLGGPTPGPGEPLWTDEDRDYALALHLNEADTCPGCGQPFSESTEPENEGHYRMTVIRCHACTTLAAQSARFTDGMKQEHARGLSFHIQHE